MMRKPWVNLKTQKWFEKNLNKEMEVFEFGSGFSTIYFSEKCKSIITVEHDPEYAIKLLLHKDLKNLRMKLVTRESYETAIDEFEDGSFDLIFIDGPKRAECLERSKNKIKEGGYIVVDDSQRKIKGSDKALTDYFAEGFEVLNLKGIKLRALSIPTTTIYRRLNAD